MCMDSWQKNFLGDGGYFSHQRSPDCETKFLEAFPTWRIIPDSKWLITIVSKWLEGVPQPYLGDLRSPCFITTEPSPGMILQVVGAFLPPSTA